MTTTSIDAAEVMAQEKKWWIERRALIKDIRRIIGVTEIEIAERMGYTRQTIHGRLSGDSKMEPWDLAGFAAAMGLPKEVLEMNRNDAIAWIGMHPEVVTRSRCCSARGQRAA